MRTKRILGLMGLGWIALSLTGCSKHGRIYWCGPATDATPATLISGCRLDDPYHYHKEHIVYWNGQRIPDVCTYPRW